MNRWMRAAAWLTMIVLAAVFPLWAASVGVQTSRRELVLRDYNTWTGVLRLWKCEGWQSGNGALTAWLNTCIARFEKQHKGVYIQLSDVSDGVLSNFAAGSVNPPDMILYAPGMLEAPYDLIELPVEIPVRSNLSSAGIWQSGRYAVPVALGGYAIVVNRSLMDGVPEDWSRVQLAKEQKKSKSEIFVLDVPADGAYKSWSAALMALFAGSRAQEGARQEILVGEGIDVGLPAGEARETPKPSQEEQILLPNVLPDALPKDFRTRESVYSRFTSGEIAAMPVTQREIRRLELLEESGKAPDWQVSLIGRPFTDQIALFSVTARQGEDMAARQQLCIEFMELILSEEMQAKLTTVRAFSVRDVAAMYSGKRGMSAIEEMLGKTELLIPPAFSSQWRIDAQKMMDDISAGESTQSSFEKLKAVLDQMP